MKPRFVIVEHVEPGSAAERAGLQCGDHLTAYAGQFLTSPHALLALEENTFGDEAVILCGEREGQRLEFTLPPGRMGVEVRPELPDDLLAEYEQGREAFRAKQFGEAAAIWSAVAPHVPDRVACAWLCHQTGNAAEGASDWKTAHSFYSLAYELLEDSREEGTDTAAQAIVWEGLGRCADKRQDLEGAFSWLNRARQTNEAAGRSLWVARNIFQLGLFTLNYGDLTGAEEYYRQVLEICESSYPNSLEMANVMDGLGTIACARGDLAAAQEYSSRALVISERLKPDSWLVATSLTGLGVVAITRGDAVTAEKYFTRALPIFERDAPGSLFVAIGIGNLGGMALKRGDFAAAHDYHHRAFKILERIAPGSRDVALGLSTLGVVAQYQGDLVAAQDYFTRSLALLEQVIPGESLEVADIITNLGYTAALRGDWAAAAEFYMAAFDIIDRLAPNSLQNANILEYLGRIALGQHPSDALNHFQQAVGIVERLRAQIAAPEARALLFSEHLCKYAGLLQSYLILGDIENAFLTLERSRARSLLELLAARTQDLADAPPELLREQQEIDRQRSQTYDQLSQVTGAEQDAEKVETLHRTLRELERRQQDLTAQIRAASPHYADLQYPQPLSLAAAQATLEPGTLLLSYLVDEDRTNLFAVTATHAEAHVLPVGLDALQEQVRSFRQALNRERLTHDPQQETAQGRALYAQLLQPVTEAVRRADRLLICPDGPLHTLPFAALVTNSRGAPKHLGAQKALSHIQSATIYAQVRAARSRPGPPPETGARRLLAFGDPLYRASARTPEGVSGNEELSLLQTRGLSLAALPNSRVEVESLARLFGDDAMVRLGAEATKTAVLADSGHADRLHFACHAWFDPEMPLSSGLILSQPEALGDRMPPGDNGLLQAWEIFQKLTLSADLVVLSACQSGLGQEVRGEGLVGLTRAFQYAGARSLVVSLWDVNDASTSLFMQSFYAALRDGAEKDEALRQGVLALQAEPRWNSPYYWGAFVLIGDRN